MQQPHKYKSFDYIHSDGDSYFPRLNNKSIKYRFYDINVKMEFL